MRRAALLAVAAAALPAPALAADWRTFGFDNARTGFNPSEVALAPSAVPSLRHLWEYNLGGVVNAQPLLAEDVDGRDVVYAGSERGRFAAIDAETGTPVWTRRVTSVDTICNDVPEGIHGVSATPVLDRRRGTIWVAGGDGRVWAFDLSTGRTRRGWPVRVGRKAEHVWGALALSRGRLLVATASHCDNAFYRGRLVALDPGTGRRRATWLPVGRAHGGGIWGWGGVVVDSRDGDIYVATANAQYPRPENYRYAEHLVRLSRTLDVRRSHHPRLPTMDDNDFGGSPILFRAPGCPRQLAVVHKNGQVFLYDRDRIRAGPRQRLQAGSQEAFTSLGAHAYWREARTLYLGNASRGKFAPGLVALRLTAGCRLARAWEQPMSPPLSWPTTPALAGGIVVYGDGEGKRLHAFDARDGTLLWTSDELGNLFGGPIVGGGRIFAPSWDNRVHAFGL